MLRRYPPVSEKLQRVLHGGDYNPDQWPPEVWDDDMRLMRAANVNVATVGVFSWAALQPAPDRFEFGWLDTIMDKLADNGIHAVLATPTAAHPAWLSQLHPEVLRADASGRRRRHGNRVNFCPNSTAYREACAEIVRRLAERYAEHPALILWHVSNEYSGQCFCETCAEAFRSWLKEKYGSLEELNRRWWTAFWSHTYTDWSQVEPPYENGEQSIPALKVDWARFSNESLLGCYLNEKRILSELTPHIPVTTNMMAACYTTDYRRWAPHVDVISWDCYPSIRGDIAWTAFCHDLMRDLKPGRPFLLMEQTPSSQNWQPVNALKRPGQMRLWSYMALAHGSDSVMYFQWRRGRGGAEMLHGAVLEHAARQDARVFREVCALGAELASLEDGILGSGVDSRVAVVFDWENWWALDNTSGPVRDKKYCETVFKHYRAFWQRNVPAAVVGTDVDPGDYDIIVAPMLYMVRQEWARKIEEFVSNGGRFVTTYLSGWVDEDCLAYTTGYPGPLRKLAGVWVEEIDALFEDQTNRIIMKQSFGPCRGEYSSARLCDILHAESATVLATYGREFYAGWPAVTENQFGDGFAYYIGTDAEAEFLLHFYRTICADCGVQPVLDAPPDIEVRRRAHQDRSFLFLLNHGTETVHVALPPGHSYRDLLGGREVSGEVPLRGYDVRILEEL